MTPLHFGYLKTAQNLAVEGAALPFRAVPRSDKGRRRQVNEDSYLVEIGSRFAVFAVADGVGGGAYGAEASRLALDEFFAGLSQASSINAAECENAVRKAHGMVCDLKVKREAHQGVATTFTAIVATYDAAYLIHVGDSRAYSIREDVIELLTSDHTVVQEMLTSGVIDFSAALRHPAKHLLTRALGGEGKLVVDLRELPISIFFESTILLLTDGVTAVIEEDEIAKEFASSSSEVAISNLITLANYRGGPDNITLLAVHGIGKYLGPTESRDKDVTETLSYVGADRDDKAYKQKSSVFARVFCSPLFLILMLVAGGILGILFMVRFGG